LIFITAKFPVKPEHADDWPEISRAFTEACNAEEGCLFFRWSRSLDDPTEYVLIEAFRDDEAGAAHVQSEHFRRATAELKSGSSRNFTNISYTSARWDQLGSRISSSSSGSYSSPTGLLIGGTGLSTFRPKVSMSTG